MNAPTKKRLVWVGGTRGELLMLAPMFRRLCRGPRPEFTGWLLATGEHGMAAHQALDLHGIIPDEFADLCHPADEPAVRLNLMLSRVEAFVRQRKGTHVIFAGYGQTAAAAALYTLSRGCAGLWLRPPDPLKVIPQLRYEAGLERVIKGALYANGEVVRLDRLPWTLVMGASAGSSSAETASELDVPGLRSGNPRLLIAANRREWSLFDDTLTHLVRAAAGWARNHPGVDFVLLGNLNASLERPYRSMVERPENLLIAPPLPQPRYRALLGESVGLLTDSPLYAAEAFELGLPVAMLGDQCPEEAQKPGTPHLTIHHQHLHDPRILDWLEGIIGVAPNSNIFRSGRDDARDVELIDMIRAWAVGKLSKTGHGD